MIDSYLNIMRGKWRLGKKGDFWLWKWENGFREENNWILEKGHN